MIKRTCTNRFLGRPTTTRTSAHKDLKNIVQFRLLFFDLLLKICVRGWEHSFDIRQNKQNKPKQKKTNKPKQNYVHHPSMHLATCE